MKQRERKIVREQTGRKDYENSRKSMQSTGTREMEVLRSLSILNPEEMDDTEVLKDLSSLGKPPSFDGKDTMPVNTAVDTRETFVLKSCSPTWSESERTPQSHQ